jgi:cysteine desulfurase / selenocysteine lyase
MAVTEFTTPLDLEAIRADFPILKTTVNGKRLVFLDSAASSQKPRQVIDTLVDVYETSYANVHRGVYHLGAVATERYEGARDIMARFVNASSRSEVVFVREATEALNLIAYAYGRTFVKEGDAIVATEMEHHSNLVPWQYLAQQTGATLHYLRMTDDGRLDPESLQRLDDVENVKLVTAGHVSNSLGTINDIPALADWAHARDAVLVVDGAQAAPHRPVDVRALGCDFYAISGHKMCGPGAGILWGREELLDRMPPFLTGGEMIRTVQLERTTWNDLPWKFEAGTPAIAESIALGAAAEYLQGIGLEAIEAHEHALVAYAHEVLEGIDGVTQYGPKPPDRAGILSFNVGDIHPHDVAQVLDSEGIAVRAGHHCTQLLMRRFDLTATTRASVYLYNGRDDVDALAEGIDKVKRTFGV